MLPDFLIDKLGVDYGGQTHYKPTDFSLPDFDPFKRIGAELYQDDIA